jgi:hypothetical protein
LVQLPNLPNNNKFLVEETLVEVVEEMVVEEEEEEVENEETEVAHDLQKRQR